MVYPNLRAEMTRFGVRQEDIANAVSKSVATIRNWMYGNGEFSVGDAFVVRDKFFPGCSIEYLFKREESDNENL